MSQERNTYDLAKHADAYEGIEQSPTTLESARYFAREGVHHSIISLVLILLYCFGKVPWMHAAVVVAASMLIEFCQVYRRSPRR